MSEKIETPKSATSASLDDARRKLYWPLKPEEGGGYFLWRQFDAELATKMSEFFVGGLYQREVISKRAPSTGPTGRGVQTQQLPRRSPAVTGRRT